MSLIKKIYRPSMTVGQLYAKVYGSSAVPRVPVGNVLSLTLSHSEEVQRQADMTRLGGGTYAKVSRISAVTLAMQLADWNPVNFARSVFGTASVLAAGTVTDESHATYKGGLIRLAHLKPSAVTVKKGTDVIEASSYEVRPEGIFVPEDSAGITDGDTLLVSYTHPEMVNIEAITSAAPELEFSFGGLNEADSGNPVVVDVWRASLGIAQTLPLLQSEFATLDVEAEVLKDPNRSGVGLSPFYRAQMV